MTTDYLPWLEVKEKMKKLLMIAWSAFLVALLAMPATTHAGGKQPITRTFQPSAMDSWLNQRRPNTNYGSDSTMIVRSYQTGAVGRNGRSVVQFDISQIPQGSTVSSATLSLYASAVPARTRTYYAHRITTSWDEGTVTWNTPWKTPGGDYAASPISATTPSTPDWMKWDVTKDVEAFIAGTYPNYGWLIKDDHEGDKPSYETTFYTKEEATETLRPKLVVTFTAPWDSYSDSLRNTVCDNFTNGTNVVYMKGTGFLDSTQTYNVSYYDGVGTKIATDASIRLINVSGGRGQLGDTSSPYEPTYTFSDNPGAEPGTWHAVVQPSGATSFPSNYSTLSASPDTYSLIADDTFTVDKSAIPEFATVMAAIGVAGLCFGIYWWMRRRYRRVEVRIQ